jgi:cell division septation protein DedD
MNSKMTEKQKTRRNRFNAREDDFILADLNVMPDDEELSPVPLNHLPDDEDAIDRLLIDADFEAEDKLEQAEWAFPAKAKQVLTPDFNEIADDADAIDRLLINTGFDANDEQEQDHTPVVDELNLTDALGENFDERSAMTSDVAIVDPETNDAVTIVGAQEKNPETAMEEPAMIAGIKPEQVSTNLNEAGITGLNQNRFEQENIQKRLNDCEHKVKKTAVITYVSLGICIVALMSTIAMAVIISGMKTEISKLTELVSILEEDMSSITEKNSDMKFNSNDSSIEQLNQKVNNLPKQLHEQSPSVAETSKSKLTATVIKQATINKSPGVLQTRIHALEKKKPSEATVKKVSAKKQVQVKKAKNIHTAEDWFVNLVSFKEKDYAKSKAAKLIQKGVPVKVMVVDVNNATLYRLKVGGFKNKLDAASYAAKIKKSLNLNSVSVDNNI